MKIQKRSAKISGISVKFSLADFADKRRGLRMWGRGFWLNLEVKGKVSGLVG